MKIADKVITELNRHDMVVMQTTGSYNQEDYFYPDADKLVKIIDEACDTEDLKNVLGAMLFAARLEGLGNEKAWKELMCSAEETLKKYGENHE